MPENFSRLVAAHSTYGLQGFYASWLQAARTVLCVWYDFEGKLLKERAGKCGGICSAWHGSEESCAVSMAGLLEPPETVETFVEA